MVGAEWWSGGTVQGLGDLDAGDSAP